MADRLTMCNMAIEAGGKNGIIAAGRNHAGLRERPRQARVIKFYESDPDAAY